MKISFFLSFCIECIQFYAYSVFSISSFLAVCVKCILFPVCLCCMYRISYLSVLSAVYPISCLPVLSISFFLSFCAKYIYPIPYLSVHIIHTLFPVCLCICPISSRLCWVFHLCWVYVSYFLPDVCQVCYISCLSVLSISSFLSVCIEYFLIPACLCWVSTLSYLSVLSISYFLSVCAKYIYPISSLPVLSTYILYVNPISSQSVQSITFIAWLKTNVRSWNSSLTYLDMTNVEPFIAWGHHAARRGVLWCQRYRARWPMAGTLLRYVIWSCQEWQFSWGGSWTDQRHCRAVSRLSPENQLHLTLQITSLNTAFGEHDVYICTYMAIFYIYYVWIENLIPVEQRYNDPIARHKPDEWNCLYNFPLDHAHC